jgi:hypothetical protein
MPALKTTAVPAANRPEGLRWAIRIAAAWALLSLLALMLPLQAPGKNNLVDLELAGDAAAFERHLREGWLQDVLPESLAPCGFGAPLAQIATAQRSEFPRLRCNLLVDSVGFAPAYAALLALLTIALYRRRRPQGGLRMHLLCIAAVIAFLFDVAENGMTMRAAEDALNAVLGEATVSDVRDASLIKWHAVALAFALMGSLAWWVSHAAHAAPAERRWLRLAALAALAGAVAFVAGTQGRTGLLMLGFALAGVSFAALVAWHELCCIAPSPRATKGPLRGPWRGLG